MPHNAAPSNTNTATCKGEDTRSLLSIEFVHSPGLSVAAAHLTIWGGGPVRDVRNVGGGMATDRAVQNHRITRSGTAHRVLRSELDDYDLKFKVSL
jgi:hypothetical protein